MAAQTKSKQIAWSVSLKYYHQVPQPQKKYEWGIMENRLVYLCFNHVIVVRQEIMFQAIHNIDHYRISVHNFAWINATKYHRLVFSFYIFDFV